MCRKETPISPVHFRLLKKYGELLSLEEIAELFKYKTTGAVRKAHSRGVLPVVLYKFSNKTGFYAKAYDVAVSIEKMKILMPDQNNPTNTQFLLKNNTRENKMKT